MSSGPFAAVLLAGGLSRRMGCDKALLPLPGGGLLWERQLAILRALAPAELFISGPAREGFPDDVTVLADSQPNCGPLAGIATALRAMRSTRLVVLAVDLPAMTTAFLRGLVQVDDAQDSVSGHIPQMADRLYEPLAAVYPRDALPAAEDALNGEDWSLQTFVRTLIREDLARTRPVTAAEASLFANWNEPRDVTR